MDSIQGMMHTCICRTSATAAAMTTRRRRGSRRGDKGSASDTSESQKEQEFRSAIRCAKQGDLGPLRQLAIAEGFGEYGRVSRPAVPSILLAGHRSRLKPEDRIYRLVFKKKIKKSGFLVILSCTEQHGLGL